MSSGFSGGMPDSFTADRRAVLITSNMNNSYSSNLTTQQQFSLRSTVPRILPDAAAQIRRKRSLDEFHQHQSFLQQQQNLGLYLRNVKPRPSYQYPSTSSVSGSFDSRHQQRHLHLSNRNGLTAGIRLPADPGFNSEKNTMNHRLQELEKQLLDDEDDGDTVSAITNSEWSDTIQNLIGTSQKLVSPSPTSSSSSCCSTSASPPLPCPKQASIDAAASISEGKPEVAAEILTRLPQVANASGTSEQRIAAHMVRSLKSRLNPSENPPPPASELFSTEHAASTKSLHEFSPCFKLGIMAANLAILEAAAEDGYNKIHVLDFDVGHGGQYGHLLHSLDSNKSSVALKITAFSEFPGAGDEKLKAVGDNLQALANKIGVPFNFCVRNLNIADLNRQKLEIQSDETLAANFAFKLYRLPDESVTTENLRDKLLRSVKGLTPKVMTVVEQELNTNTAPLTARVRETYDFYAALLDSLDSTVAKEDSVRVVIEEGLGRKIGNSVACDGRDRVERCEVFGKWRARMSMAGFQPRPMSQLTVEALRAKLNSGTRGSIVNEESGGISFGWMGRKLIVSSAWR
ncbi:Scarecrow-like 8 [Salvia divinorum]|uniref:Scarecrow-like 8 n=1 Tax=Salvia divinorum TaxID=28513 RepID=A0ABD1FKC9_SALDI